MGDHKVHPRLILGHQWTRQMAQWLLKGLMWAEIKNTQTSNTTTITVRYVNKGN